MKNDPDDPENYFYDYKITHLGVAGVPNLGGEKLLKYLAFEIFKLNANRLKEEAYSKIKFTTYDGCTAFETFGFEDYISDYSPNAKNNMFNLMNKLRCVLGQPIESYDKEELRDYLEYGLIPVDFLLDENDNKIYDIKFYLYSKNNRQNNLQNLLRKKIEVGVREFFNSMLVAFKQYGKDLSNIEEISIFLAGNSSKSLLFNQILVEYLEEDYKLPKCYKDMIEKSDNFESEEDIERKVSFINGIKEKLGNPDLKFVVYPPLRTESAKQKLQEMGYEVNLNDVTEPSCKTGVAYGMFVDRVCVEDVLKERAKKNKEDILFQYYVGTERRRRIQNIVIERNSVFGEWKELCKVRENFDSYSFFYTKLDKAIIEKMSINEALRKDIHISESQDNTFIFVRAVAPNVIEWQIADSKENLKDVENPNLITLGE